MGEEGRPSPVCISVEKFLELEQKAELWDKHQLALYQLKINKNKAIKKTVTIPEWLDEIALSNKVNFSQVLQEALKEKLGL